MNRSRILTNVTIDATVPTLLLANLTEGVTYTVSIAAANRAGFGPYSAPATLRLDPITKRLDQSTSHRYEENASPFKITSVDTLKEVSALNYALHSTAYWGFSFQMVLECFRYLCHDSFLFVQIAPNFHNSFHWNIIFRACSPTRCSGFRVCFYCRSSLNMCAHIHSMFSNAHTNLLLYVNK